MAIRHHRRASRVSLCWRTIPDAAIAHGPGTDHTADCAEFADGTEKDLFADNQTNADGGANSCGRPGMDPGTTTPTDPPTVAEWQNVRRRYDTPATDDMAAMYATACTKSDSDSGSGSPEIQLIIESLWKSP